MTNVFEFSFVETREHRRFIEFCEACRTYQYIGLCYGPPGVGKTLSAYEYTSWNKVELYQTKRFADEIVPSELLRCNAVLYTTPVVNAPGPIRHQIEARRDKLRNLHLSKVRAEDGPAVEAARERMEALRHPPQDPDPWNLLGIPHMPFLEQNKNTWLLAKRT